MTFLPCDDCGRGVVLDLCEDAGRLTHDCADHSLTLTGPVIALHERWGATYARAATARSTQGFLMLIPRDVGDGVAMELPAMPGLEGLQ